MSRAPVDRPLTAVERANLAALERWFPDHAFLTPTATGLAKSLIDAIEPVRGLLARAGIHDYALQPKGQSHKRLIQATLVAGDGPRTIGVTLYRPETKHGDPRIWFSRLPEVAHAGDMLALFAVAGRLAVVNLSSEGSGLLRYLEGLGQGTPPVAAEDAPSPLAIRPTPVTSVAAKETKPVALENLPTTVRVEPTPQILQVLGHVNFQGWQCVAELVDNSIDAFLRDIDAGVGGHGERLVRVSLPTLAELASGAARVTVEDNAGGMSLDQIQNACRAGYSGNDPVGKLGLFGMGFNVSTVRLGRVTELLSHRPGDDRWVGIRIDIDEMIRQRSFDAPVITEPVRDDDGPSGTRVRVSRIPKDGVVKGLVVGRGKGALTRKLARLYHVAVDRYSVQVHLNGAAIPTWKLCLWDEQRSVPSQTWGRIPAQMPVDISLDPLPYCPKCWEWASAGQDACLLCGGELMVRERRIRGVIGIQRSFAVAWSEGDKDSYYGIDLIRNGRVIETFDKDLFYWTDPNDPNRRDIDYPVDAPYLGGRIIGQLEIDFAPLRSYHKDSFEKSDRSWAEIREVLRGEAPLRPDIARRYGYVRPDTPLARLFDGYRKTSPAGERYLITAQPPGTKANRRDPMHSGAMLGQWISGFESGDPEYLDDHAWWEAVQWAEVGDGMAGDEPTSTSPFDVEDVAGQGGGPGEGSGLAGDATTPDPAEAPAVLEVAPDPVLSIVVNTDGIVRNAPASLEVVASRVIRGSLPDDRAVSVDPRAQGLQFTWDPRHEVFRQGLVSPFDSVATEVAMQVLYRAQVSQRDYPLSHVQQEVLRRAFPGRIPSVDAASEHATDLLRSIRANLEERLPALAPLEIDLEEVDLAALERAAANEGIARAGIHDLIEKGEFIRYLPLGFIPRCAQLFPELLMGEDGIFAFDYAGYDTEELRSELRESLYANLVDVAWLVEERPNLGGSLTELAKLQLRKGLVALELLELKRVR